MTRFQLIAIRLLLLALVLAAWELLPRYDWSIRCCCRR